MRMQGKTVVVTGSSGGIGLPTPHEWRPEGH